MLGTEHWPSRDALVRVDRRARRRAVGDDRPRDRRGRRSTVGLPDADLALDVLGEVVLRSRFDPDDLEREREVILQQVQEREDEPDDHAADVLYQTVFAGHPLSICRTAHSEGVEALTVEALRGYWHERLVGPNVLVARRERAVARGRGERSARRSAAFPPDRCPPSTTATSRSRPCRRVQLPGGSDQAHVYVGVPFPALAPPTGRRCACSTPILGRTSGRLFTEIRDQRGLAYTRLLVASRSSSDGGIFIVYAGTSRPRSADQVTRAC